MGEGHFTSLHYQGAPAVRGHFDDAHNMGINQEDAPPIPPGTDVCSLPIYAERADIEFIFGKTNTVKWADVDNESTPDETQEPEAIGKRICWALAQSRAHFDDRLLGGMYAIPFVSTPGADYPQQIISMSARLAGVMLYDARGIVDATGEPMSDTITPHRKMVNKFLTGLLAGTVQLSLPQTVSYPDAVQDDYSYTLDDYTRGWE